jgi:signal transduction histidine kinase/CheY-like chemotaxis protein
MFALAFGTAQRERESLRRANVEDHARQTAAAIDLKLGKAIELAGFCASSPNLITQVNLDALATTCGRYAAIIGGWLTVVEIGDLHRQIINTHPDAPEELPKYPRANEFSTLLELERKSRESRTAGLAGMFTGIVYPSGLVAAGQFVTLADKREAMVYVSLPVRALSELLWNLEGQREFFLGLLDPNLRIVATSAAHDNRVFPNPLLALHDRLGVSIPGSALSISDLESGDRKWDVGYYRLSVAPEWIVFAIMPASIGAGAWDILSISSVLAFAGLVLSLVSLWQIWERNRAALQVAEAERAKGIAEQQSLDKSRILASFAHEIRAPLMTMIGSLELIEDEPLSASERARSARISAESLLQSVDDILELSFLGSREFSLLPSPVDLRRLCEDLISQARIAGEHKGLVLELIVDQKLPAVVEVDRLRLQQVLSNLLTNAVKYTDRGTVRIQILNVEERTKAVLVRFNVTDTGRGLLPDDLRAARREFGRLDHGVEQKENVSGLGLAIVQRILRAMGAKLEIESEPQKGSTFYFQLLLPIFSSLDSVVGGVKPLIGTTIVYAEDEPVIRKVTARRLISAGARVVEAENGSDVLAKLENVTPDLLLLDLRMPDLRGAAVIRRLRSKRSSVSFPIFVLTSHISGPEASEARAAGADVLFTKPVQVEPLAAALRARRGDEGLHTPNIGLEILHHDSSPLDTLTFKAVISPREGEHYKALFEQFVTSLRKDLDDIGTEVRAGRLAEVSALAHRALGLCQVFGAVWLSNILEDLEREASSGNREGVDEISDEWNAVFEITVSRMMEIIREAEDIFREDASKTLKSPGM